MEILEQLKDFNIIFCDGHYWCIVREFDGEIILSSIPSKEKAEEIIEKIKEVAQDED